MVRACAEAGVAVVPQGGNTGMCAGAVPDESGTQIVLSLARMNRIVSVDADNFSEEQEDPPMQQTGHAVWQWRNDHCLRRGGT